tara:strand:- start:235 stop:693 length:459 start_codon:yes stop_codon:yes gene_type:complete
VIYYRGTVKVRWLLTLLIILSACSAEEQPGCESCDVDEFINEWWSVAADKEVASEIIGDACYSFIQWEVLTLSDTGYIDYKHLHGFHPDEDPVEWNVGAWEFDAAARTFIIDDEYELSLYEKDGECYDIGAEISNMQVEGAACPCEYEEAPK